MGQQKNQIFLNGDIIEMKEIWPNFFIVGAMKAGTSSLYGYLKPIPGVFMPDLKETHYFSMDELPPHKRIGAIHDKESYLRLFKNAESAIAIGEASPSYLADPETARRIWNILPHARIIAILRNPIERAYSHYLQTVMGGTQELSFYEALQQDYNKAEKGFGKSAMYVERGLYYEQIKRYLDVFGEKQVKILIFEEFVKNTYETVRDVLRFLEVNSEPTDNVEIAYNTFFAPRNNIVGYLFRSPTAYKLAHHLPSSVIKTAIRHKLLVKTTQKPPMEEKAKIMLQEIYHDDVARLQRLIGRPLKWQI